MTQSTAFGLRKTHQEIDMRASCNKNQHTEYRDKQVVKSPRLRLGQQPPPARQARAESNPPNEGVSRSSPKVPRPPPKRKNGAPSPVPSLISEASTSHHRLKPFHNACRNVRLNIHFHCLLHPIPDRTPHHYLLPRSPHPIHRKIERHTDSYRQ